VPFRALIERRAGRFCLLEALFCLPDALFSLAQLLGIRFSWLAR
jgi:hypothetical protein